MESRELYKQKYQAQIHEWKAKLDVMKAQAEKLSAQSRLDAKPRLDLLHAKFDAAKTTLNELASLSHDKWDAAAKDADRVWQDLKSAADGAFEAVKQPEKS